MQNKYQLANYIESFEAIQMYLQRFVGNSLLTGHTNEVHIIIFCESRNLLASGSIDSTVKLWNLENNSLIQTYEQPSYAQDLAFSNSGNFLAFGGDDYKVRLVDIRDLKNANIVYELVAHTAHIMRLTFTNDSKQLISVGFDYTSRIWDCSSKEEKFKLKFETQLNGVAISADDTMIGSISNEKIQLWNLINQQLICSQSENEKGCGIEFSNNQVMLVSSSREGLVKLWSLKELNKRKLILIRKFKTANSVIWTVKFCPHLRFILSICNNESSIKMVDSLSGQIVKILQQKYFVVTAISKNMQIIAYGQDNNIVVMKQQ